MIDHIKTVIFDWDGTLHESMHIYEKAFRKAFQYLVDKGYAEQKTFTAKDISLFLGKNPQEMWQTILPNTKDIHIQEASQLISEEMLKSINQHEAKLYPHAQEVLTYLKEKGYKLVYLSNSKNYYMEAMRQAFKLDRYFDLYLTSEMYQYIPKKMILNQVLSSLEAPMVMIGDRDIDIETGIYNAILTIGCLYGYGLENELKDADYLIEDLLSLKRIL